MLMQSLVQWGDWTFFCEFVTHLTSEILIAYINPESKMEWDGGKAWWYVTLSFMFVTHFGLQLKYSHILV